MVKVLTRYLEGLRQSIVFYVGTSAKENDEIIDTCSTVGIGENNLWFHIKGESSCHVIAAINTEHEYTKKELKYIIKAGALLCKQYSRYKSEKNVSIIYTTLDNIEKTDILGRVLTKHTKEIII
jgi:NFACT protein RNA binding domain